MLLRGLSAGLLLLSAGYIEISWTGLENFGPAKLLPYWFHAVDSLIFLLRPKVLCFGIWLHLVDGEKMKVGGR